MTFKYPIICDFNVIFTGPNTRHTEYNQMSFKFVSQLAGMMSKGYRIQSGDDGEGQRNRSHKGVKHLMEGHEGSVFRTRGPKKYK